MTERSGASLHREARQLAIGPSSLRWDGSALTVSIDEIANPLPRRVRGTVRVLPRGLSRFGTTLEPAGRHRWGPIAPCARVEVDLPAPGLRWRGHAYLDSNEGDEPIAGPFRHWDWLRALYPDDSTAVVYDIRLKASDEPRVIAARFRPDGGVDEFDAPPRVALPGTGWRIDRQVRSQAGATVARTFEDTPFYARSLIETTLLGRPVTAVHESLSIPRLDSPIVRLLLPFRMPRRR
jgi:carotenoid 1,2-hydratase